MSAATIGKARFAQPAPPAEVTGATVAMVIVAIVCGLILFGGPPILVGIFLALLGLPGWVTFLATIAALLGWGWLLARWVKYNN